MSIRRCSKTCTAVVTHETVGKARTLALVLMVLTSPVASLAQGGAANLCGNPFVNHFGPFDYRKADKATKALVENAHFTPGVESMTRPKNTMKHDMAQDVSYTLNVFPNHHRALLTMQRLSVRWKSDPPPGTSRTVDCWYDRAVRYAPDDTVVRALYAQFLAGRDRRADAVHHLDEASKHAKENPLSHYNLGLVYLELGEHEKARQRALEARELGFPRADLIDKLRAAGHWTGP